jgi:hypothetical protein
MHGHAPCLRTRGFSDELFLRIVGRRAGHPGDPGLRKPVRVGVGLEDVGPLSFEDVGEPIKVSTTCVFFATSEGLSLMRRGEPTSGILAGLCDGIADRVKSLVRGDHAEVRGPRADPFFSAFRSTFGGFGV